MQIEIQDLKFTISKSLTTFSPVELTASELIAAIKNNHADYGKWEDWGNQIWYDGVFENSQLKTEAKKNGVDAFKKQLPCFIASSNSRAKGGNVLPVIQIDIDSVHGEQADEIKESLVEKCGKNLIFAAKSPSGIGVKALLLIDKIVSWEDFKHFSKAILDVVLDGIELHGGSREDVFAPNQVCFFPNPNNAFFNADAEPFNTSSIEFSKEIATKNEVQKTSKVQAVVFDGSAAILTNKEAKVAAGKVAASISALKTINTDTLKKAAIQAKGLGLTATQAVAFLQPLVANLDGRLAENGKFFTKTYPEVLANSNTNVGFGEFLAGKTPDFETVKINKYLSEAGVELRTHIAKYTSCAIQAPTGAGKTHSIPAIAAEFAKKVIFVVPTVAILHQSPAEFGKFYADEKNTHNKITVTTYRSFKACAEEIMECGNFASDIAVIFDESHSFATQSFDHYSDVYAMFGKFGKNILISATQILFGLNEFANLPLLDVKREINPNIAFKFIECESNLRQAAADAACADVRAGIPTIVALNNKSSELIEFTKMAAANGVEVLHFNVNTKNSPEIQEMLEKSQIPANKLLVMTQVGFAGMNEKTIANAAKIYVVETARAVPITTTDLKQLSGRFRNAANIEVKVYMGKSKNNKVYDLVFDFKKAAIDDATLASLRINSYDSAEVEAAIQAGFTRFVGLLDPQYRHYLKISESRLVADERKAAVIAHRNYCVAAANSSAHFAFHLKEDGFDVEVIELEDVEKKVDAADEIKANKEEIRAEVEKYVVEFSEIESSEVSKIKRKSTNPHKKMAATLVLGLNKLGVSKESVVKLGSEITSESKVAKVLEKVKSLYIASTKKQTAAYKMREFVLSKGVGFQFTTADIVAIFNKFFPEVKNHATEKQLEIVAVENVGNLVGFGKAVRKRSSEGRTQYRELESESPFGFDLW